MDNGTELHRKDGEDFSQGLVVIGQGAMASS